MSTEWPERSQARFSWVCPSPLRSGFLLSTQMERGPGVRPAEGPDAAQLPKLHHQMMERGAGGEVRRVTVRGQALIWLKLAGAPCLLTSAPAILSHALSPSGSGTNLRLTANYFSAADGLPENFAI